MSATWLRVYNRGGEPSWLVSFDLGVECATVGGVYISAYPTSRAIVDDFGNLVLTRQPS